VLFNASKPTAMLGYQGKPSDVNKFLVSQGLQTERPMTRSQGKVEEESKNEDSDDDEDEGMDDGGDEKLTPLINHYQLDTVGSYDLLTKMNFDKVTRFRFNVPL